ncbi:MAG TPA: O-antigen ligase family protein [Myxococcales bacterium]|nr:O-antigen ligase family protein [Myxococcales bacterium]
MDRRKTAAPLAAASPEPTATTLQRDHRRVRAAGVLVAAGLLGHAFFLSVSIAGMQIALAVAALGILLAPPGRLRTPLALPVIAFVVVAVISDLISPFGPPPLAFATLWRSALGYFVVALGLRSLPEGWPERLLLAAAAGLALAAVVGLLQYRTGLDPVHALGLRPEAAMVQAPGVAGRFGAMGFFTSRLTFGHNAAILVALLAGALATRALPWPAAISAALGLAAVAVTFDRAAYLGLCAAALVIALRAGRRFALLALVLAALAALHPGVRERFATSFSAVKNSDRVFIWSRGVEIVADHPLRGIGFGNYQRVAGQYYDRVDPGFPMRTWAHNLELSTLAETGPLGLLAMLWIWIAAALALLRSGDPLATGALAALAAFLTITQTHDLFYDTKVMYALWFALGTALSRAPRPAKAG